jgi:uncharacterized repeat protein (TIGR03803 family)
LSAQFCFSWGCYLKSPAVFKLSKSRKETVLHSFTGGSSDGAYPYFTGLFMDPKGNLYGVTYDGGASSKGVVYKLRKSGAFTLLHSFAGGKTDGCYATGAPAMDTTGNLYGTTHACGSSNLGIVWKLSEKGAETVLHNFGPSDAEYPFAGVIMDANGNLYGETSFGGPYGAGTVFELNQMGTLTLLHSFLSSSDGAVPEGGLIRDVQGNFYGTAFYGGSDGYGTVWKLTP